jgi:hypothetical protein
MDLLLVHQIPTHDAQVPQVILAAGSGGTVILFLVSVE